MRRARRSLLIAACMPMVVPMAYAGQTINATSPTSCVAQNGSLSGNNLITDFENGTFGTESGAANQSPTVDPYPSQITGGVFDHFYDFDHGDYGYIANPVTPRNPYQHAGITDPVYGATGRFFASDPNVNTPTLDFNIFNVTPNVNYEISFWAANSEPNGTPNIVNTVLDGITSYSTGPLPAFPAALEWRRHAFVFNAGNRTSVAFEMASTETGAGGRDFYVDNVEMQTCAITGGIITGTIYTDSNTNNAYNPGTDGVLSNISVQLWDTKGDSDPSNDIFVSTTTAGGNGAYNFQNIAPLTTYELRVDVTDPDLPGGASPGTSTTLSATVTSGGTTSGKDFGFDLSNALLEASKSVSAYNGLYAIPGNDVIYTITIINRGGGETDNDSVFLVDTLPADITFYNGDMDDDGNLTSDPVAFAQTGAGLEFIYSRDIRFAAIGPKPASLTACNYTPLSLYDANVAYVCFNPKGNVAAGSPNPSFSFSFRAGIK